MSKILIVLVVCAVFSSMALAQGSDSAGGGRFDFGGSAGGGGQGGQAGGPFGFEGNAGGGFDAQFGVNGGTGAGGSTGGQGLAQSLAQPRDLFGSVYPMLGVVTSLLSGFPSILG